jgi:hypothetical protein
MERHQYDHASKWLLEHHGDALLRLAGVTDITAWRPLPAEIVQPRQLPDGLLEVRRAGQTRDDLFVIEIATDPERRVAEQLLADSAMVYLDRGVLPEVVVIVLRRKGQLRVPEQIELSSSAGWTNWRASWRVVELWSLQATDLLAHQEPGLAPWATVAQWDGRPEVLLQRCRDLLERVAGTDEYDKMLTVTAVLASIKYNDPRLLDILGGKDVMIDSPLIREIVAEQYALKAQKMILHLLQARIGEVPADIAAAVRNVQDEGRLDRVNILAARAKSYRAFRRDLDALLAQPSEGEA